MPTYEYECRQGGLRFERSQSMTDAPLSECPECRGEVRRLISGGSGFIIKGSGHGRSGGRDECSLDGGDPTCCGRDERCGQPTCRDKS